MRSLVRLVAVLLFVLAPAARAQTASGQQQGSSGQQQPANPANKEEPKSDRSYAYPVSMSLLPVESAFLRSRIDLQLAYTHASTDFLVLALDGQLALGDRFQLGLNLPVLMHASVSSGGTSASSDRVGDLAVKLKGMLFGRSGGLIALSLFANVTLPTHSGDGPPRNYGLLHDGLVVSSFLFRVLTVGLGLGTFATIRKDSDGGSVALFDANFFFGATLLSFLNLQLAMQVAAPIYPSEFRSQGGTAFSLTPAIQLVALHHLHIDLGARIAVNDAGRVYTYAGRAALIFAVGGFF